MLHDKKRIKLHIAKKKLQVVSQLN